VVNAIAGDRDSDRLFCPDDDPHHGKPAELIAMIFRLHKNSTVVLCAGISRPA